jgi:hypothetical protein
MLFEGVLGGLDLTTKLSSLAGHARGGVSGHVAYTYTSYIAIP